MTKRKFHIRSFNNNYTVFEVVRGGERAVSKTFPTKDEAQVVLAALNSKQEG